MTRLKTINFTEGFRSAFINTMLFNLHSNPLKIRPKRKKEKNLLQSQKLYVGKIRLVLTFWSL